MSLIYRVFGCCFSYFFARHFFNSSLFVPGFYSKRRARTRGAHGERKTKKDPQAENYLFQLPARRAAEALPEGAVPRPARESGACGSARPHSDAGRLPQHRFLLFPNMCAKITVRNYAWCIVKLSKKKIKSFFFKSLFKNQVFHWVRK